jgi:hypothetical protein
VGNSIEYPSNSFAVFLTCIWKFLKSFDGVLSHLLSTIGIWKAIANNTLGTLGGATIEGTIKSYVNSTGGVDNSAYVLNWIGFRLGIEVMTSV